MRLPSLVRAALVAAVGILVFMVLAPGCGRTSLEPETLDGGTTPPATCTPQTCPTGCCDRFGACRTGSDLNACGQFGGSCTDCAQQGFTACSANKTCTRPGCDNCRGCCDRSTGVEVCHAGTEASACGVGGAACVDCASDGRTCDVASGACGASKCDPSNCAGCCVGDKCLQGLDQTACGTKGLACDSCQARGQKCEPVPGGGGACQGTPTCGPANCGGCCDGTTCVTGGDATACGKGGQACADCAATGKVCAPLGQPNERTCQTPVTCGPKNCPGCCSGNTCVIATSPGACGSGGNACTACGLNETCDAGVCTPVVGCSAANCAGCCIGDICATGAQDTACGAGGVACQNCTGQAKVCQGGACETPVCGPSNCAGCCSGNTCVIGTQNGACGRNGLACDDCNAGGQVCQGRQCRDKCGPANCLGCCNAANTCVPGFANANCGSGGAACVNCNALGSSCDGLVTPRVCASQQDTCPAKVGACDPALTTPVTADTQGVCTDVGDLDALEAACAGGPDTATCQAAFTVLQATNSACALCMQPFDRPFNPPDAIFLCAAPGVSASCRHTTACASDCLDTTCNQCDPASFDQCINDAESNGGQCRSGLEQSLTCLAAGDGAQLALCNPQTYGFQFGTWLRAVGRHFCGAGP